MKLGSRIPRLLSALAIAALVAGVVAVGIASADWLQWECQDSIVNYSVSGGYLNARGCRRLYSGTVNKWRVWSDTYVPYSDTIFTEVKGYDRCTGGAWNLQMETYNYDYDDDYGTSGVAQGYFLTCSGGHDYWVHTRNLRKAYSWSTWEGTTGDVYW